MTVVQDFAAACRKQEEAGRPTEYEFARDLIRGLKIELVNMDVDEAQESFFLDLFVLKMKRPDSPTITIEPHYVDHLREFLQGAA